MIGVRFRRADGVVIRLTHVVIVACFAVGCTSNAPDPRRYPVFGIDVSRHQGALNWRELGRNPPRFAFIKATEGADLVDPYFARNWPQAATAGLVRGAYHFFTFCTPGASQAQNFMRTVPAVDRMLPPAVDVEFVGNCRSRTRIEEDLQVELAQMLNALEEAYRVKPILYVTPEASTLLLSGFLSDYPLWIRSFSGPPSLPSGQGWAFWQFTDEGRVGGIEGPVDLSVYEGSLENLMAWMR
jgi:lysozyme